MDSFYVSLPSHKTDEYPNNQNNDFKVRLPVRIPLSGDNWKVGLVGIVLPNVPLFEDLYAINGAFFSLNFYIQDLSKSASAPTSVSVSTVELKKYVEEGSIVDGEGLMNFIRNTLRRKYAFLVALDMEHVPKDVSEFSWKTDSGSKPVIQLNNPKKLAGNGQAKIHKDFALAMGWLEKDGSAWKLGPNLVPIPYPIPDDRSSRSTGFTTNIYFQVSGNWMKLSQYYTWEFSNLNEVVFRKTNLRQRPIQIYSDVGRSMMVGNQVTDLLREVEYSPPTKDADQIYFEPKIVYYHDVRNVNIEIATIQISETDGKLVKFKAGQESIVTLHFKKK